MAKFKIYLEYEGTRYSGWQVQKGSKTIQGALMNAADQIFPKEKIDIQGSGRTDAGVHALQQVAHLEVNTSLSPEILKMKFNDLLPHDINILHVEKTGRDFHARHHAVARSYIFHISKRRSAFGKTYVWWIRDKLNINKMEKAAILFTGMHDFSSFTDDKPQDKSTKVKIDEVKIWEDEESILIRITGSHFLWKMVRRMIGVLVEIGRGNMKEKDLVFFLNNHSKEPARFTAPPSGLYLEKIFYEGDEKRFTNRPLLKITSFRE